VDDAEAKVKAFYTFWRTFSSWRDFSADDEHKPSDIETAGSRDERRFMIRENEVAREKRKKEEYKRIQTMVERAYVNDPRIAKFKLEAERAKEGAKKQKEDARKAVDEAKRKDEELKLVGEKAEREKAEAEKKERLALKARIKKAQKRLRDACLAEAVSGETAKVELALDAIKDMDPRAMKDLADAIDASKRWVGKIGCRDRVGCQSGLFKKPYLSLGTTREVRRRRDA
jgi:hypothetical protein